MATKTMTDSPSCTTAPDRRQRLTFRLLCLTVGLESLGVGVLFPLLAKIQAAHHLPTYGLGAMSGAYFFAALAAQVVGGRLLDGRRAHAVLLGGLLLGAVALVWFAFGTELWQLVASRCVGGLCYGIVGPAALRAGTVGIPASEHGARLGRLSSSQMAGIMFGPLVGSVLASLGGLSFPFLVVAAGLVGAFVAMLILRPATTPTVTVPDVRSRPLGHNPSTVRAFAEQVFVPVVGPVGARRAATRRGVGRRSRTGVALRPLLALLFLAVGAQMANGLYDALWSRLLTDRGATSLVIGLSLTLFGIPFILLAPIGGRLASRRGPLMVSGIGLLIASGFLASYGLVASPLLILILGSFEAVFQAVAIPGSYAAVATVFADEHAATGQGWFGAAGTASAGAAALVGAPLYAAYGPGAVFAGGAVVSAVFVVAAMFAGRGRMQHRVSDAAVVSEMSAVPAPV